MSNIEEIELSVDLTRPGDVKMTTHGLGQGCTDKTVQLAQSVGGKDIRAVDDEDPSEAHRETISG